MFSLGPCQSSRFQALARTQEWLESGGNTHRFVATGFATLALAAFGLGFYRSLRRSRPPAVTQMLVAPDPAKVRMQEMLRGAGMISSFFFLSHGLLSTIAL